MSTEAKVGAFVVVEPSRPGRDGSFVRTTQNVRGQAVYTTYFRYAGGIGPGTPVLFGGIRVGRSPPSGLRPPIRRRSRCSSRSGPAPPSTSSAPFVSARSA